jgi:hypothetical protein
MNEEFMVRIGANARAMYSELQRAGSYAKAWATTLAEDFKSRLGRMFAAGFIADKTMELLGRVKDRILAISRAQEELPGTSTNFIQGLMNWTEKVGLSFEAIAKPMLQFKRARDEAIADPTGKVMQAYIRYGVATSALDLKNQNLATTMARVAKAFKESGNNLSVLSEMSGRAAQSEAFLALMGKGPAGIQGMEAGNFFTKLTPQTIAQFKATYQGSKDAGNVLTAFLGNAIAQTLSHSLLTLAARAGGQIAGAPLDSLRHPLQRIKEIWSGIPDIQDDINAKLVASINQQSQQVEIQAKFNSLKEHERELRARIDDQGKEGLSQMASAAAKLTGYRSPLTYQLTPLMRESLQIQKLEDRARLDWENKRVLSPKDSDYWKQAQSLRAANPWLKDEDRDPLVKIQVQLKTVIEELGPISRTMKLVNEQAHGAGGTW